MADAYFQDRLLIRPDDFRSSFVEPHAAGALAYRLRLNESVTVPGVGIEPTPPGSEPSIATIRNCPGLPPFIAHDSGRRIRTSIVGFKDRYPTFRRSPINLGGWALLPVPAWLTKKTGRSAHPPVNFKVSCGSRTHLSSLEGWHLCRSAKDTSFNSSKAEGEGVEPSRHSRTLGRVRGGCHRQLACPSVSQDESSGGRTRTSIVWLTASRSTFKLLRNWTDSSYRNYDSLVTKLGAYCLRRVTHSFGNNISAVRTVGFEPTLSGSQGRRISRLSDVLTVRQIARTELGQ